MKNKNKGYMISKKTIEKMQKYFNDLNKVDKEILPFIAKNEPEFYNFIVKYVSDLKNDKNADPKLATMAEKVFFYAVTLTYLMCIDSFYNLIGLELNLE